MTLFPKNRYLEPFITKDLQKKMVLVAGPRQVGKTTLALNILKGDENHPGYFNWDNTLDRRKLLDLELPPNQKLIVLDEVHKFKQWRNWLKGLYDKTKSSRSYLVTGSARLDYYRRGGDSLTGRYHFYRLHPLSLKEIDPACSGHSVKNLLEHSGFPEPFFEQSQEGLRRWHQERNRQILKEDLRDLERVSEISLIEQLVERLPQCVGSPLSINALREDLQVAHQTVQNWINILERLYMVFRLLPYGTKKIRAVKKENKMYFWDWTIVPDAGARFENFVASQLLRYCHFIEDTQGHAMELRYLRDNDKREIDFVVMKDGKPVFAVEAQLRPDPIDNKIAYFANRTPIPKFYLVHLGEKNYEHGLMPLRVLPFNELVKEIGIP